MTQAPSEPPRPTERSEGVKSAVRALLVLETLADGQARSLTDLAATLDLPKSSLHGILRSMAARDWLTVDASGTRYSLGVRALVTGQMYLHSDNIVGIADPVLDSLAQTLDETIHLGQLAGPDIVYLAKRDCSHPLRLVSAVGRRLPAHATAMGKVLLAEQPDDLALSRWTGTLPRLTDSTIVDRDDLAAELARIRRRGYAIDDGESTVGLRCFAVAIRTTVPARYALSCSIPIPRLDASRAKTVVKELLAARDALEARAGTPRPSVGDGA
jgi:DNA-binding IclR family transcriptional regulator